jgi:putative ABC transport system permease protein
MNTVWQDIRYGLRMLTRNPGFSCVVVLILAIGIGANTAMLSVVDAVMFQSVAYKDPDTLVHVCETDSSGSHRNYTSYAGFRDWQEQNHVFEQMVAVNGWDCAVQSGYRAEKSRAMRVSQGFFSVLGIKPILGRTFLPDEERPGGDPVIVVSHSHWRRYFNGDPNVIGKTIILNRQAYTVVGVLPADFRWVFQGHVACGLWVPMSLKPNEGTSRSSRGTFVIARLKQGISVAEAQAEMDLIADRLAQAYADELTDKEILVVPIGEEHAGEARYGSNFRTLLILLGTVGSVLLIACLHVANLLISRSVAREREVTIRAALGAHRFRLVRQLLVESAVMAGLACLFGLLLAHWGTRIMSGVRSQSIPWYLQDTTSRFIPWFVDIRMNGRVLLYAMGISLLTCILFGLLPALSASRINLSRALSTGRTLNCGPRFQSLRNFLVTADIAIAFVLLVSAGLLISTYVRLLNVDFQFNPKNVLSVEVELYKEAPPYSEPEQRLAYFRQVLDRIRNLPGVQFASGTSASPITGSYSASLFEIKGSHDDKNAISIPRTKIFPDYFRVLHIPLLKGRYFTEQDIAVSAPVVLINEVMAQRFWPGENPVGKYITKVAHGGSKPVLLEIIGVVGNVRHTLYSRYSTNTNDPEVYVPAGYDDFLDVLVGTRINPKALMAALHKEIRTIDSDVLVGDVTAIEDEIVALFSQRRLNMLFLNIFAAVALILASLGVYSVTAYAVSQRTHEIGVRIALGARNKDVLMVILKQGLKLTFLGISIGLIGAFAITWIIRGLLYDVTPTDPFTYICVSLILAGVALSASYIPARRAAKVDPMEALRYE